jgi:glycosyltransferase involved in cell wall biosynthesis
MIESDSPVQVTILTPVYNEEASLPLYERAVTDQLLSRQDYEFNILFIEDGSDDNSWKLICQICKRNPHFTGIRLSRNFGSHIALSAGFARARGNAVATLACDLQDPPEVILSFLEKWRAGAKIVWGLRRNRDDRIWKIIFSHLFARLIGRFAMPEGSKFTTGSFLLVDQLAAQAFCQFQERNRITFALVAWSGFEQAVVRYDRKRRLAGVSGWNFRKMLKTMYDAFIGFSFLPIRIMTLLGIGVFVLSLFLLVYLVLQWLIGTTLLGWTGIMFALTFFFGLQFLLMGISGEYLYRIYSEVVQRPLYFVSDQTDVKMDTKID